LALGEPWLVPGLLPSIDLPASVGLLAGVVATALPPGDWLPGDVVDVTALPPGDWLPDDAGAATELLPGEVALSTALGVSGVEAIVGEVGVAMGGAIGVAAGAELETRPLVDDVELLVLATRFGALFAALMDVVSFGGAVTALLVGTSSRAGAASGNLVKLSLAEVVLAPFVASVVLAPFVGVETFESATLEAFGAGRGVFSVM
jgi:hypothetical protein